MHYGSKSKNKIKPKEPQRSPRILGLGLIKLDFYLNLTDDLIKKYKIDFSKINSPKDLAFIAEDPTLLDLIQISSSDTLSNILLYINKASISKSFVELITLSPLRIHPEEEHMKKIFTHVTEHNYLFSNEMSVTSIPNKISFAFKNGKKLLKYFDIMTDYDPYTDEVAEDTKKISEEKSVNKYSKTNKHDIKEVKENMENSKRNTEAKSKRANEEDMIVKSDIYNDMSGHFEMSGNSKQLFEDEVNYKINEVHEEDNSPENMSLKRTESKKNDEIHENSGELDEEMIHSRNSEGAKSNKSKSYKKVNNDENNEENNEKIENYENYDKININENMEENEEDHSIERPRSLKSMSENNESNKKNDLDFEMDEIEEIKDDKISSSYNQSKKKEKDLTIPTNKDEDEYEIDSKKNKQPFVQPYEKNSSKHTENLSKSIKNTDNKSTNKKKYLNTDKFLKENRDPYTGEDESHNEKSHISISVSKLINIPAACEIEEYDFLFIDLEEFINFHLNGFNLFELAEFMKKISNQEKKPRMVLNYPNILINLNVVNLELLEIIMNIMSYSDIFLFEKKECLAFFNMLSQMNYEKDLSEKQLIDYFFKEVPHVKTSVGKLGLFLDELQKFNVAEQKRDKIVNNLSYEISLYPKINHFNQKIVDEYKKIMTINNSYFKSIFFGGYFSSFVFNEDHYTSYIAGAESTKRILEIFKNKIDFPINPEFYLIKLQKNKIARDLQTEKLKQKEEKFVLDCINKTNSTIKFYNPLFDDNLNAFFASGIIRKQLKDKGFINTNGFVLYDSSYKGIVGVPPKIKKRLDTSERERHLLLAIKQNKELLSTDLESFSKSLKGQSPTNRKLPLPNIELNSSNLYISSKIKNLKVSKKKLKPIVTRNSNSKQFEKSSEIAQIANKKSNTSQSPKKEKDITIKNTSTSQNNSKNRSNQNKNKASNDVLSTSLLKDREDNYNYKDHSKISSANNSILDNKESENDIAKSKSKSKTYSLNMSHGNQKYTENNKEEEEYRDQTESRREIDQSKNNEDDFDVEENKDSLEKSKGKNQSVNFEDENMDNEENKSEKEQDHSENKENEADNQGEMAEMEKNNENNENNEMEMEIEKNENAEMEMEMERNEEEEKRDLENIEMEENNLEKFEIKKEQDEENMNNEMENRENENQDIENPVNEE